MFRGQRTTWNNRVRKEFNEGSQYHNCEGKDIMFYTTHSLPLKEDSEDLKAARSAEPQKTLLLMSMKEQKVERETEEM